jgi:hypothetical protein
MNRHEKRRSLKLMEMKMIPVKDLLAGCCFNGCGESFDFKDGGMPAGWQAILMYADPHPVLDLSEIKNCKRDGFLCPEHAEAVQDLLFPLMEVATRASEGNA